MPGKSAQCRKTLPRALGLPKRRRTQPMAGRSTQEVVSDHLALAQMGEVWRDLERNLAPDCVILTTYGVFHGHEGALRAAQLLDEQVGETQYDYRSLLFHGEIGFLE